MRSTIIAFDILLNFLEEAIGRIKDPRGKSNILSPVIVSVPMP
jgi:hypothetical protein